MTALARTATAALAAVAMIAAMFASAPDASAQDASIVDIAVAVSSADGFDDNGRDYDILIAALGAAGLVETLADPELDVTVFAPDDRAFLKLARDLGWDGDDSTDEAAAFGHIAGVLASLDPNGDPIPLLTTILLYHVSGGSQSLGDVFANGGFDTLAGASVSVGNGRQLVDAAPSLKNPRPYKQSSNIEASNGVIHTINRVLIPLGI